MSEELKVTVTQATILKGIGKINGDGWKDKTKVDEVVFVWNEPLPSPYAKGQYPRVGNEIWSASWEQYDFTPASAEEVRSLFAKARLAAYQAGLEQAAVQNASDCLLIWLGGARDGLTGEEIVFVQGIATAIRERQDNGR